MARTAQNSSHKALENYSQPVESQGGILSYYPAVINNTLTVSGAITAATITVTGTGTYAGPLSQGVTTFTHTPVAINSTASATAAQVASGYITSTSGAPTTITLPTATAIAAALPSAAVQGTVFDLYIDNTAGANTVTITPDSSMTKSQVAQVATYGVPTFGLFTVASGVTGIGCFRMVFSSGTALCIARVF
jgi:hypothetical protein